MGSLLIHGCTLIDCTGHDPRTNACVRVEGERIASIGGGAPPRSDNVIEVDAAGRVLMPGLIDAHAHLSIIGNITDRNRGPLPVHFLKIAREIEETLADGFTTVRDAGGLDWGYKEAIRQGSRRRINVWRKKLCGTPLIPVRLK
jgi:imidazolonepropionase-like amidohydrolase